MAQTEIREIVSELEKTLQCNCDLDSWEPQKATGHSRVCRIHKRAVEIQDERRRAKYNYPR